VHSAPAGAASAGTGADTSLPAASFASAGAAGKAACAAAKAVAAAEGASGCPAVLATCRVETVPTKHIAVTLMWWSYRCTCGHAVFAHRRWETMVPLACAERMVSGSAEVASSCCRRLRCTAAGATGGAKPLPVRACCMKFRRLEAFERRLRLRLRVNLTRGSLTKQPASCC
jgi:hypothetical protein